MSLATKLLGIACGLLCATGAGCSNDTTSGQDAGSGCTTGCYKYASSAVLLPSAQAAYSLDFDGSGKGRNQLGNVINTVSTAGFDLQGPISSAVASGQVVVLFNVTADSLDAGPAMVAVNNAASSASPPAYKGMDTFMIQAGQKPASLGGTIQGGALGTVQPKDLSDAQVQSLTLSLPLGSGVDLPLVVWGLHAQGTISKDGIMSGQMHGVVKKDDVDSKIIPALADLITKTINGNPMSATSLRLITLFERKGSPPSDLKCMVPRDCCANNPSMCKITGDEVRANFLVQLVLAPDLKMFDNGKWKPTPGAAVADLDALSVGLGFTAVAAKF